MYNERKQAYRDEEQDRNLWFRDSTNDTRNGKSKGSFYWDDEFNQEVTRLRKGNRRINKGVKRKQRE